MMIDKQTPIATPICNSTFPFVCEDGLHSGPQHFLLQSEGIMMTFFCYDQFFLLTYYYTQLLSFKSILRFTRAMSENNLAT